MTQKKKRVHHTKSACDHYDSNSNGFSQNIELFSNLESQLSSGSDDEGKDTIWILW